MDNSERDLEAVKVATVHVGPVDEKTNTLSGDDDTNREQRKQPTNKTVSQLNRVESWLNKRLNVETRGIDRVPENERQPPSTLNMFLIYWGAICHVGVVPIGVVGPLFGFSLRQSTCGIVFGTMIGALCPAFCVTLGPKTGLRAIATSRYSFGFYGAKLCALLNIFVCGSYLVINFITISQILSAVSGYILSLSVGSIIVGILSYTVSLFGFHVIHQFERYSWIVPFILLCILLSQVGPHLSSPSSSSGMSGPSTGAWLSFFAITISATSGWCSVVGDYYCHYPASTKRWKVFSFTWLGLLLPTVFTLMVGACIGNAAISGENPEYTKALIEHGIGGLLHEIYHPVGWSKFCLVVLTFTVIGNNVLTIYSSGLSMQLLGHGFHAIPRFIWSLLFSIVTVVLAVAGQNHLITIVSNTVALLGYWGIAYTFILLIEDLWFRNGHPETGYDLSNWDQPSKLPPGVAAVTALFAGYLAGGVTGMAQTWYVGPIAAMLGKPGGDVGLYLTALISSVVYLPSRYVESKITRR